MLVAHLPLLILYQARLLSATPLFTSVSSLWLSFRPAIATGDWGLAYLLLSTG